MQDLIFNFYGNYTRQTDIFNSALQFNNGAIGPPATPNVNIPIILNPFGTTPGVNPIAYNQFTCGAAVTKTFNQLYVTLRGTVFDIVYDHSDNVAFPFQTSHDGASFWLTARAGYNFTPHFTCLPKAMGFFNISAIHCSIRTDTGLLGVLDRMTQRVCSEVKSMADIGLKIRSREMCLVSASPTDINSGVFGGRLSYFPTRYWAIIAQVDQTLGISTTLAPTIPAGIPTRTTTAILQTTYGIARDWSVGVRGGYTRGEFIGVCGLNNHSWMAGASFNYEIWRNLMLTLDYQYTTGRLECGVLRILRAIGTLPALHINTDERGGLDACLDTKPE